MAGRPWSENGYNIRNRRLAAGLGRWVQRDPYGYIDGPSQYEYVRSRPTRGLDPSGGVFVPGWEGEKEWPPQIRGQYYAPESGQVPGALDNWHFIEGGEGLGQYGALRLYFAQAASYDTFLAWLAAEMLPNGEAPNPPTQAADCSQPNPRCQVHFGLAVNVEMIGNDVIDGDDADGDGDDGPGDPFYDSWHPIEWTREGPCWLESERLGSDNSQPYMTMKCELRPGESVTNKLLVDSEARDGFATPFMIIHFGCAPCRKGGSLH